MQETLEQQLQRIKNDGDKSDLPALLAVIRMLISQRNEYAKLLELYTEDDDAELVARILEMRK